MTDSTTDMTPERDAFERTGHPVRLERRANVLTRAPH